MDNLKANILNKINNGEITQTSKFYFITRDYVFYILTFLSVVLGSIAVSSILFQSISEHIRPLREFSSSRDVWLSFVKTAPYLWLALLVILVLVAWINFKHTKRAYKTQNAFIVAAVITCSLIGGSILFATGYSESIERQVRKNIPAYKAEIERRQAARDQFVNRNGPRPLNTNSEFQYIAPPHRCPIIEYTCAVGEKKFKDNRGCGCTSAI